MSTQTAHHTVDGSMETLLFHQDPERRMDAALHLEGASGRISDQRKALEALSVALRDPSATVQEAALQSLMRMSVKNG